jgi:hypothetical protein
MTRCRHRRLFSAAMLLAVPVALCALNHGAAQSPRRPAINSPNAAQSTTKTAVVAPTLVGKLTSPYQIAIDGKPLRELLRQIAGAAGFNLWIDRNIDPDQLVSLPGGQKTVFTSLVEACRASNAEVVAVGNVVLVGQRQRIEQLAGAILALQREPPMVANAAEKKTVAESEIRWPEATTPAEALRIVSGQAAAELPHDHWPAVAWRDISPQVATLLVTSQFDLMPPTDGMVASNAGPRKTLGQTRADRPLDLSDRPDEPEFAATQLVPLASPPVLTLRYPVGTDADAIRSAAIAADPRAAMSQSRDRSAGGAIELSGAPAAHVAAISAMLTRAAPRSQTTVDIDNVRFTLNVPRAPAQDVLIQLAAAAGRKLQVSEQAATIVRRPITFNAEDQSLRQLVKTVTDTIGANALWSDDLLTITPSP